jgi:hypothetical protein
METELAAKAAFFDALESRSGVQERFPAKWLPVRVKKTRQNKEREP